MFKDWSKKAAVCDAFVQSVLDDYSVDKVAELLLPTGLLIDNSTQYTGSFERYVFLKGDKGEVYTTQEIDFISSAEDITVFGEFYKRTRRGVIPCRVVVTRSAKQDPVAFCIAFTKVVNKAIEGFNICVVITDEGIVFACRSYETPSSNSCFISNIIRTYGQMEEKYDTLMYSSKYDLFIDYYSYVRDCIRFDPGIPEFRLYNDTFRLTYAYLDELSKIGNAMGLDFSRVIDRCFWEMEEPQREATFADRVAEAEEFLFAIEPSHVNTMEMLLEAEEMEQLAIENERNNEMLILHSAEDDDAKSEDLDAKSEALLEDPESMIKILKKKRGI